MRDRTVPGALSLRVDPTVCDASGLCASAAPGLVTPDPWGFPLFPRRGLDEAEVGLARAAVAACPRRALLIDGED